MGRQKVSHGAYPSGFCLSQPLGFSDSRLDLRSCQMLQLLRIPPGLSLHRTPPSFTQEGDPFQPHLSDSVGGDQGAV